LQETKLVSMNAPVIPSYKGRKTAALVKMSGLVGRLGHPAGLGVRRRRCRGGDELAGARDVAPNAAVVM
jgi:hypothetical protein